MLPSPEKLRTPLYFTEAELSAFRGSNIFGATLDRRREWEAEWQQCRNAIPAAIAGWGQSFTWYIPYTLPPSLHSLAYLDNLFTGRGT